MVYCALEVELQASRVKLVPRQRMKLPIPASPAQQIYPPSTERPCTRACQQKPQVVFLDHEMHFVQEVRTALNLVYTDNAVAPVSRSKLLPQQRRIRCSPPEQPLIKQIPRVVYLVGKLVPQITRLSRLPRAKEKDRPGFEKRTYIKRTRHVY